MPYLSEEQITEIELQMADLLEQLKEMNRIQAENDSIRVELLRMKADVSIDV